MIDAVAVRPIDTVVAGEPGFVGLDEDGLSAVDNNSLIKHSNEHIRTIHDIHQCEGVSEAVGEERQFAKCR